jgi:hypothetical protein
LCGGKDGMDIGSNGLVGGLNSNVWVLNFNPNPLLFYLLIYFLFPFFLFLSY